MTITKGMTIVDNDPRNNGKTAVLIEVERKYAFYQAGKRKAKIRLDRIYSDGKPRKSGWSVVV